MDYNSGAAPQPGGYAGPLDPEAGHAVPNAETVGIPVQTEEELAAQVEEARAQQVAVAEKTLADYDLRQDILDSTDEAGVEVPEGDLDSRIAWVSEPEDLEERHERAQAVYEHEEAADPDADLATLGGRLTAAVYGERAEGEEGTENGALSDPANDRAPQRTEESVQTPEPGPEDYAAEEWTYGALKDEIDKRNEGRDEHISKAGSTEELRARLVEDDAAAAAAGE